MTGKGAAVRDSRKETIFAYGFDLLGFDVPTDPVRTSGGPTIAFVNSTDARTLERSDGVIIPQGIFEEIELAEAYSGMVASVKVQEDLLLEKEREVLNLLREDKWVCFLVQEVIDRVPHGYRSPRPILDTDLCKRFLNKFHIRRNSMAGLAALEATDNAFSPYVREYGAARTVFWIQQQGDFEIRPIVRSGDSLVGIEVDGKVFFLPFHITKRDGDTAISIATTVCEAIDDYRQKHRIWIPEWLDTFQFKCEPELRLTADSYRNKLDGVERELRQWKRYKAVLTTSGDILRDIVAEILQDFFGFHVEAIEEWKEDLKIVDDNSEPLGLVEVKGTKGGIRREYINQVDSHRDRNNLDSRVPGVLIINNEMGVSGSEKRLATTVPSEHIKHARGLNILIVRTIDLLFVMPQLEGEEQSERRPKFLRLLTAGGGWLKAT